MRDPFKITDKGTSEWLDAMEASNQNAEEHPVTPAEQDKLAKRSADDVRALARQLVSKNNR